MKDPFEDDDDRSPAASDLIGGILKEKAPRAALALAAIQTAVPGFRYARSEIRSRRLYTVRVRGGIGMDGLLYDELHAWILSQLPPGKRKAVIAKVTSVVSHYGWEDEMSGRVKAPAPSLHLLYDGNRTQAITVRGHKIRVTANEGGMSPDGRVSSSPEICFSVYSPIPGKSLAARDALLLEISKILKSSQEKTARKPVFRMLDKWDEWSRLDDLPPRALDSVVLSEGQSERIVADVQRFLDSEEDYNRRSIPWHRGHLYTGPSGTGKTSMARAIASHFSLDMWYLPLSDVRKDSELIQKISGIRGCSVLLLEDIDVFREARERDDEKKKEDARGATLSGLLNALDGLATPHGLLTIMTTNHPEKLDEALIRTGRADLTEHFALSGAAEASRLITRWYNQPCPVLPRDLKMSASDISEVCKSHDSAIEAAEALNGTP